MALLLKRIFEAYSYLMDEVDDPRTKNLFLVSSPLPAIIIVTLWFSFIFKWGQEFMKNREPFNLKKTMMVYNLFNVCYNLYILYLVFCVRNHLNWRCSEVDYSDSYQGLLSLKIAYLYLILKVIDLVDTVLFVLRKKVSHLSFLHVYHHSAMILCAWIAAKFVGGGQSVFVAFANGVIHVILYSYYLLTAYDSKYSKSLWLKKFITQAQLIQFAFIIFVFGQTLFRADCKYPKILVSVFVPQNFFMILMFSDFYVRTYILEPRRKKREFEKKMREPKEDSNIVHKPENQ